MTLSLDHQQRLHVSALLGMLECRTVVETRAAWMLMDRLALDDNEKQAIDFRLQSVNGNEAYSWNPVKSLPAREYDLSESELKQVQRALNSCPRFVPGLMRGWLEPLLAQLPEPAERDGAAAQIGK
jgi:hypothetical protein